MLLPAAEQVVVSGGRAPCRCQRHRHRVAGDDPQTVFDSSRAAATPSNRGDARERLEVVVDDDLASQRHDLAVGGERVADVVVGEVRPVVLALFIQLLQGRRIASITRLIGLKSAAVIWRQNGWKVRG
jgi:hypothetical protein